MSTFSNIGSRLVDGVLEFFSKATGTTVFSLNSTGAVSTGAGKLTSANLGFGALEAPTIASGVLTVTKSFVNPLPESSTSDTVDSIVKADVAAGDVLLILVPATNTITFDDANINLGAGTRAVAPGGSLLLAYDGTEWTELYFTAASDNV